MFYNIFQFLCLWAVIVHLFDSLIAWGCQGGDYAPGAARVYLICSLAASGWQGGHYGPCDSLGWQSGDFAFSASFLILNEIMRPGEVACCPAWDGC